MNLCFLWLLILIASCPCRLLGETTPPYQSDFPPEEFQARWKTVFDRIGDHAVAIVQGAPKANGFLVPRQTNEFYHLCGIETPHAYLILDGRARKVTLFLPPRDARLYCSERKAPSASGRRSQKRSLASGPSRARGPTEESMRQLIGGRGPRFTPFSPAEGTPEPRRAVSRETPPSPDIWDGRRGEGLLRAPPRFPGAEVQTDLILDETAP